MIMYYTLVAKTFQISRKRFFSWYQKSSFKINSMNANPAKFQFMILGKKKCSKQTLKIDFT